MSRSRQRLGHVSSFFAAVAMLAIVGCSDDPASPDPDPDPNPVPYSTITTYAGAGVPGLGPDGQDPLVTAFYNPQDLTFGPNGQPYIIDFNNHRVRTIRNGVVETVIGTGEIGDAPEGLATTVRLNHPTNVAFDPQGRLILAAWHNSKLMRLDLSTGWLERFAGDGSRAFLDNVQALSAKLDLPVAVAISPAGETYICDEANVRIRKIDTSGMISTICGDGTRGYTPGCLPAASAQLNLPAGQAAPPVGRIALANGILYIADTNNSCVRRLDTTTGEICTFAGTGAYGYSGDGGPATSAQLFYPADVDLDAAGNVYIADTFNNCIRRVDTAGIITTFAGVGDPDGLGSYGGDGGAPAAARLDRPFGIAFDADENFYIADTYNNRIRVIRK